MSRCLLAIIIVGIPLITSSLGLPFWVLGAGFVLALVAVSVVLRERDHRLARTRAGFDPDEYTRYLASKGIPRPIAEITRAYFQDWMGIADFQVLPSDNIGDVYGIVDDDVDDVFFDLLNLCGRRDKPDEGEIGCPTINTVEDLVTLIARLTTPEKCDIVAFDDTIDYESRAELALLLRRFAIGRITYLQFEQGVNALPWNGRDGAIPGVVSDVRKLLKTDAESLLTDGDNFHIQDRIHIDREMKHALARMVMFLYSDLPYRWRWQKHLTVGETVFLLCTLAASAALMKFGYVWGTVALLAFVFWVFYEFCWVSPRRDRRRFALVFPFARNAHFVVARWRPRLLNGRTPL